MFNIDNEKMFLLDIVKIFRMTKNKEKNDYLYTVYLFILYFKFIY